MTFSIAARDGGGGYGVAIASSSPAVGGRCAHARAGCGAVATQNITDPALGPRLLDALAEPLQAQAAIRHVLTATPFGGYRQLLVIGERGPPAVHNGEHALGIVASAIGADCAAAGNLLAHSGVPQAMVRAFEASEGLLASRLLAALQAALALGGEMGPIRSAGLLVVRELSWPIVDLRVDWHESPLASLAEAWRVYAPQLEDYVQRALDPAAAPAFGVPGDLKH